ncbi:MAG TPA: amidohydrolase family protein [Gemmatimonadales bacterium]
MTVIDFHNHFYPLDYIAALREHSTRITVTTDTAENPVLHSPGDENVIVPGHRDVVVRTRVLDEAGVDMQVLSFTAPGTVVEQPATSVAMARRVNDALAAIVADHPKRYTALATLPLNDAVASRGEAKRVLEELRLPGIMLYSNVNGVALHDQRFWPLYELASERGTVLYIHPTYPVGVEAMESYWLMPLVGFLFDTTLAAAGLVFSGVVERFPGIQWALGHLGGAIPYLAERLDRGYEAFADCRKHIGRPPSEFLRGFYYDTVNFDPTALRLALEFAGPDHLLAGSDYPHQIGSIEKMLSSIRGLGLHATDEAKILGGNATRLLGL